MKKVSCIFPVLIVAFILASCNSRKQSLHHITELQAKFDSVITDMPILTLEQKVHADDLIIAYTEFVENYPDDSLAAKFMFETSRLKLMIPDYAAALQILESLVEKYPADEQAPLALSSAASLCENVMQDCKKAEYYLMQLKEKYPNHPTAINIDLQIQYVCDAQGYLDAVLGKQPLPDSVTTESTDTTK